jgi:hypothetical protein
MGFFATYLFSGGTWTEIEPDQEPHEPAVAEPWLYVDIHDSDIATVMYAPAGPASGIAFLGVTPRTYFEDDAASPPTDTNREAKGLAAWWAGYHGEGEFARAAKARELRAYLADDGDTPDENVSDEELDDADVFVEAKTAQLIDALGLPLPVGLPS